VANLLASSISEALRKRLKNEPVTNCHRLKMKAQDGKMRETDVALNKK
jgi:hypothetical protein